MFTPHLKTAVLTQAKHKIQNVWPLSIGQNKNTIYSKRPTSFDVGLLLSIKLLKHANKIN